MSAFSKNHSPSSDLGVAHTTRFSLRKDFQKLETGIQPTSEKYPKKVITYTYVQIPPISGTHAAVREGIHHKILRKIPDTKG